MRRDEMRSVGGAQRGQRGVEVRPGPIELVHKKEMRHFPHLQKLDDGRRLGDPLRLSVDDDHRRIGRAEHGLRLFEEVDEARRVDQVHLDLAAGRVGETDADRLKVADRFGLAVGGRGPVTDRTSTRNRAAVRQHCLDERGLSAMMRSDDGDVP